MRLERVGENQIKLFLSIEELTERGLTRDDVEKNSMKWHQLYFDMLKKVYDEFEFAIVSTLLVDILALNHHELVLLITLDYDEDLFLDFDDEIDGNPQEEQETKIYCFRDIEHVIQLAKRIANMYEGGTLYNYKDEYFLLLPASDEKNFHKICTVIMDYGAKSNLSVPFILEYGIEIIKDFAINKINKYFLKA